MSARVILYNVHVYVLYTVFTVIANKQSNINEDTKKACAEEHFNGVEPKDQMEGNRLIKMFEMTLVDFQSLY